MAIVESGSPEPANPSHTLSSALPIRAAIAQAWRSFMQRRAQARRNRKDMEDLSRLDDLQLKDIGLTRSQIEWVVAKRSRPCTSPRHEASTFRVCDEPA